MKAERKLERFGTQMERKRNANGTQMERRWNANGTQMERIYERVPNAFSVRLFLSSTAFLSPEPFSLLAVTRGKIGSGIND